MLSNEKLSDLIGMIYDAAGSPHLWQRFIAEACNVFRAHISNLILLDSKQPSTAVVQSFGIDWPTQVEFANRVHEDYWVAGGKKLSSGSVVLGSEMIGLKEMHKTAFYKEMATPNQAEYMVGAVIENRPERQALISFIRGKDAGNFDETAKRILTLLMPHIQRAHYIHLQLANKASLERTLDESPYGVVLMSNTGNLILSNKLAEQFWIERDGMTVRYGELKLYDYRDQRELDSLIRHAQARFARHGKGSGGILRVRRPSGKLPYQVTVSPLCGSPDGADFVGVASFLLLIHDPTIIPSLSRNMLKTAYSLTNTEACLCERLFDGMTLEGAATELGISRNTAKTHLKRIFDKCEVNSQPALMRLVALGLKG
jgi:DNA-binding CsgD family transcriptional regulator